MKQSNKNLITVILIITLLLTACSVPSRKNELIYRFDPSGSSISIDSLKSGILGSAAAEMLVVYPDSDVVIIHYDRFKTHQDVIEKHFLDCGYKIILIEKNKIEEKDQPWQKK